MCAPEGVLPRLDDFKGSPIVLRYGLDGSHAPAGLMSLPGAPKPLRAFAPEDCSPRGTFVARPSIEARYGSARPSWKGETRR